MTKPLKSTMNFISNVAEDVGDFFTAPFEKAQTPASAPSSATDNKDPIQIISAPAVQTPLSIPAKTPVPGSKPSPARRQASFLSGLTGGAAASGLGGGLGSSLLSSVSRKVQGKSLLGQ